MSILHETARAYAEAGIPVFPCLENSKKPACAGGFRAASVDRGQIDAWWGENPNYNVALSPEDAGWCVVDIEANGEAAWHTHAQETPSTREHKTPRGGRHLIFAGSLPSSVRRLFPGEAVDTRGSGGYILIPPSVVDGSGYEVLAERELAAVPAWIATTLASRDHERSTVVEELDLRGNIDRGRALLLAYCSRGDVAVAGRGGNDRTYRLSCELRDLGLSPGKIVELLWDDWNPSCSPPWSLDELTTIVDNTSHYGQNEPGVDAVLPAAEVFGQALEGIREPQTANKRSKFYFEDETEQEQGEDPTWLIPELIPERSTILMVGATGSFKSFLALDICLSIATSTQTFGSMTMGGITFYAASEGRHSIKKKRRRAWKIAREIETASSFYVGAAPIIAMPDEVQEFGDQIVKRLAGKKPRLIVLDTLAKCMAGLNENDAGDAGKFIRFCDSLVEAFDCSVLAIHHTGKDHERGARGSSAFHAGFDSVLEVRAHRASKSVEVWVRKHKDAEEREQPWTFEGRAIAGSLVFFSTNADEHRRRTVKEDGFDPRRVGASLRALGAIGAALCVTTKVLATQLVPPQENETPEQREAALAAAVRSLRYLARSKLAAYCETSDRDIRWFLPT